MHVPERAWTHGNEKQTCINIRSQDKRPVIFDGKYVNVIVNAPDILIRASSCRASSSKTSMALNVSRNFVIAISGAMLCM